MNESIRSSWSFGRKPVITLHVYRHDRHTLTGPLHCPAVELNQSLLVGDCSSACISVFFEESQTRLLTVFSIWPEDRKLLLNGDQSTAADPLQPRSRSWSGWMDRWVNWVGGRGEERRGKCERCLYHYKGCRSPWVYLHGIMMSWWKFLHFFTYITAHPAHIWSSTKFPPSRRHETSSFILSETVYIQMMSFFMTELRSHRPKNTCHVICGEFTLKGIFRLLK